MEDDVRTDLREALKTVAVALKETGLPFALIGGYAVWARGGPESDHDVDFVVAADDAPEVARRLADSGLMVVQPPEDWLFKVYVGDALVDVIYRPAGTWASRADLRRATNLEVLSVDMPVMPATDLLTHKLNALDEHSCDLRPLLPVARALREQVDWEEVRRTVAGNPFAEALLFLLDRLEVTGEGSADVTAGRADGRPGLHGIRDEEAPAG